MKTKIVSFGDSFVYGTELQNNHNGHQSWIGLAAKKLNVAYKTLAVPGCGNENIFKQILFYFSRNPAHDVLAVINWTYARRWDIYFSEKENWTTLGMDCVPRKLSNFIDNEDEASKIIEFYKKNSGPNHVWNRWRSLQTIYCAQQYLKSLNIKVIQTYMDTSIWDSFLPNQKTVPDYIQPLQAITKFELETFEGLNFLEWSRKNGYKITDPWLHPLEEAHQAACELWLDRYQQALNE